MSLPDDRSEDHMLMARVGKGDIAAYQQLVRKYLTVSLRFAERMMLNRADAEDVMQEVHLKLWKEAPNWRPEAKFTTWFYRVIFNACIDHKRKRRPTVYEEMETIIDHMPLAEEKMLKEESASRVKKAIATLPERQRAALSLSYYEGVSNAEAAAILDMNVSALQVTLFRAREQLKKLLRD